MTDMGKVAENIKALRQRQKLSQAGLAAAAGVSQQVISQLENNKNESTKYLPQIAKALGVSPMEIDPDYIVEWHATIKVAVKQAVAENVAAPSIRSAVERALAEAFQSLSEQILQNNPESLQELARDAEQLSRSPRTRRTEDK